MAGRANLTVTTGPDRGSTFDLVEDLTHIGRGPDNQIVLSDATLLEHQLSIVSRNGRYAVYALTGSDVAVQGNVIPAERWVWLPSEAAIQISRRTVLQFTAVEAPVANTPPLSPSVTASRFFQPVTSSMLDAVETKSSAPGAASATDATSPRAKKGNADGSDSARDIPPPARAGNKANKRSINVARFITDGPGDPLVRLGEDGHLPVLTLDEGHARDKSEAGARQGNPLWLVAALSLSFGFSLLMVFMDAGEFGAGGSDKARARRQITEYFGGENDTLKPYQTALRQAQQAYARRDRASERQEYRKVLQMLRAEGKSIYTGLTGDPKSDEELERLISVLLSD